MYWIDAQAAAEAMATGPPSQVDERATTWRADQENERRVGGNVMHLGYLDPAVGSANNVAGTFTLRRNPKHSNTACCGLDAI
jgi:hypothetical protein